MKTTENYKVDVCNHQKIGLKTDVVRESGIGSLRCSGGKYYLMYKTGKETVMIKIFGDKVTVKRVGESNSEMEFVKNKTTKVAYETPYGVINMEIVSHKTEYSLNDKGGEILLAYDLIAGGDKISNKMEIRINKI